MKYPCVFRCQLTDLNMSNFRWPSVKNVILPDFREQPRCVKVSVLLNLS